jgi:glyoxylase-like metal-dependent hydrolase (beta-lactamase superfamily II)
MSQRRQSPAVGRMLTRPSGTSMYTPRMALTIFDRRTFLGAVASGVAGLSLTRGALGQQQPPPAIVATRLADDLTMITGAGANVTVLSTAEGLLMVDGGLPDRSAALLEFVKEHVGPRPVRFLFNTHWHLDHTGSNETIGKAGGTIVAHENTKRWLSSRVEVEAQHRTYEPRPPEAIPTRTFTAADTMTFGGRKVEYGPLPPGHTDGDIYVFFREANVLVVSDALAVGRYPIMDYSTGGWITGLIDAADQLVKRADMNTRVIAGTGPPQNVGDLQAQRDMLVAVRDRVQPMVRSGKSLPDVVGLEPTREFDAKWGSPQLFLSMVYMGLVRHT